MQGYGDKQDNKKCVYTVFSSIFPCNLTKCFSLDVNAVSMDHEGKKILSDPSVRKAKYNVSIVLHSLKCLKRVVVTLITSALLSFTAALKIFSNNAFL